MAKSTIFVFLTSCRFDPYAEHLVWCSVAREIRPESRQPRRNPNPKPRRRRAPRWPSDPSHVTRVVHRAAPSLQPCGLAPERQISLNDAALSQPSVPAQLSPASDLFKGDVAQSEPSNPVFLRFRATETLHRPVHPVPVRFSKNFQNMKCLEFYSLHFC